MVKAAVIGVGSMGRNHARVYSNLKNVELVGVSDANHENAETVGRLYNSPHYIDYKQLLDEQEPDLVSVCVPTVLHFEVVKDALERKIHVLIEKPITATVEEGEEVIALAKKMGVFLTVGHIERFNPAIAELKKRLDAGELGEIFRVQGRRMGPFPARIRDVGVIVDLATHDVDILRYILNADVERVYAEVAQNIHTQNEDMMDSVLSMSNGAKGTLNINWMTPTKVRELAVTGTHGMFIVNYLMQELYFYENGSVSPTQWTPLTLLKGVSEGNMTRIRINNQEPLAAELAHFVECVEKNEQPIVSGEDGLKALAVALALVESGQTHKVIQTDF